MSAAWVRRSSLALTVVLVALGTMTYRAVSEGSEALAASDAAFNRGDLANSVLYARRAAVAYAPGAPHTRAALARLRAVAVGSEGAGDIPTARLAWGAIRSSALETRHLATPYARELDEANRALARLAVPSSALSDVDARARAERRARELLARAPGPSAGSGLALLLGFLLSTAGLLWVAARGITREGRPLRSGLALGLTLFAVGAACWTWAAFRA